MNERYAQAQRVSILSLCGNILLAVLKAVVGLSAGSAALLADALHSVSDSFSTGIVMIGSYVGKQPPDAKHPYGHGRAETVAAKLLSVVLIVVGINMGYSALRTVLAGTYAVPGIPAIYAAGLSILTKEGLYRYGASVAHRIEHRALMADAWHHRSDALSSVASLFGIGIARLGYPVFDPIFAIVVSLLVVRVGVSIFRTVVDELMDAQVDAAVIEGIRSSVLNQPEVRRVSSVRVHRYGREYHVDLVVSASAALTLPESHRIIHQLEGVVLSVLPAATHVDVHINPERVSY